uniref:Integrase core domain containing protein n=1 Tax=Solanum tuberosum TaxID=4113 RepID=M1D9K3_SOLTU
MAVTTRGGKQTIDPHMPSEVEIVVEKDDNEIEVTGGSKNVIDKETEMTQKVVPMPRPPPPFPKMFVKKNEEGKYHRFITMLEHLSINVPLIETLEEMLGYVKFMKDLMTKKRAVSFEDDYRLQHCSAIATRSMKQESDLKSVSVVNHIVERGSDVSIEERLGVDALAVAMMNFEGDGIEDYDELVAVLDRFDIHSKPKRLELDMKNRDSPPTKSSIEEAPKLELTVLPSHLSTALRNRSATRRLLIYLADLIFSFRAWHTGTLGETIAIKRLA